MFAFSFAASDTVHDQCLSLSVPEAKQKLAPSTIVGRFELVCVCVCVRKRERERERERERSFQLPVPD